VLGVFGVVLLLGTTAFASGPSIDGTRGLLRIHSADPHAAGYVAGSIYGMYARETYTAIQSPRGNPETVKFGASALGFTYSPTPFVEIAAHGLLEGQFVDSEPNAFSEKEFGISDIAVGVKTLLTPASRKAFMVGAELGLATTAGNQNALYGTWDSDGLDISGRLNLTYQYLNADNRPGLRVHANSGYVNRTGDFNELAFAATGFGGTPDRSVAHGDQFLYGAGIEVPTPQGWTLFTEWTGEYDVENETAFADNPMRITPGLRWATNSGSFVWTSGVEIGLADEEVMPAWQFIGGLSFGGFVTPVTGLLQGLVRDAETGEPIANARVSVRNSTEAPVSSDMDGRFKTPLQEGYVVLELSADGYSPKTRVVEMEAHDQMALDFTLSKRNVYGQVRGRVRDSESGDPLFGRVRVAGTNEWVETDPATGAYTLENVPEGSTDLEFDARNYKPTSVTARILASDTVSQDVSLERDLDSRRGVLSGYVRDGKSGAVVAATVTVRGKSTKVVTADPTTGLYEVEVESGNYNVSVNAPGYLASIEAVEVPEQDAAVKNWELNAVPKKMTLSGVFFDSGTATIKRESFTALEMAASFLSENPDLAVVIEGHTDSTGTMDTNMALSQRRADAVMKFLVVNYGVSPARLTARGLGPQEPIANNETNEGRALNRRIEFRLMQDGVQ
jgi:outer membrane protein OmpA-like peptidoglycan-associated protein